MCPEKDVKLGDVIEVIAFAAKRRDKPLPQCVGRWRDGRIVLFAADCPLSYQIQVGYKVKAEVIHTAPNLIITRPIEFEPMIEVKPEVPKPEVPEREPGEKLEFTTRVAKHGKFHLGVTIPRHLIGFSEEDRERMLKKWHRRLVKVVIEAME